MCKAFWPDLPDLHVWGGIFGNINGDYHLHESRHHADLHSDCQAVPNVLTFISSPGFDNQSKDRFNPPPNAFLGLARLLQVGLWDWIMDDQNSHHLMNRSGWDPIRFFHLHSQPTDPGNLCNTWLFSPDTVCGGGFVFYPWVRIIGKVSRYLWDFSLCTRIHITRRGMDIDDAISLSNRKSPKPQNPWYLLLLLWSSYTFSG